jgi:hypothetical protein
MERTMLENQASNVILGKVQHEHIANMHFGQDGVTVTFAEPHIIGTVMFPTKNVNAVRAAQQLDALRVNHVLARQDVGTALAALNANDLARYHFTHAAALQQNQTKEPQKPKASWTEKAAEQPGVNATPSL